MERKITALKKMMDETGLNQSQLAVKANCNRQYINQLLTGKSAITFDQLFKLGKVMRFSMGSVIDMMESDDD